MPEFFAPNLSLSYGWATGEDGWGGPMSANMRLLDALLHLEVLSSSLSEPPGAAVSGDRYIVGANPVGAWLGHAREVAVLVDGEWQFYAPRRGWSALLGDGVVRWNGSEWIAADGSPAPGGPGGPETPETAPRYYDIGVSLVGALAVGELLAAVPLTRIVMLAPGAPGSHAVALDLAPTGAAEVVLYRDAVEAARIVWSEGSPFGVVSTPSAVVMQPGNLLRVVGGTGAEQLRGGIALAIRLQLMGDIE